MTKSYSIANIKFHYDNRFIESLPPSQDTNARTYHDIISRALDEPFSSRDPQKFTKDLGMYINQYTFLQFLQKTNVQEVFVM